MTTWRSASVMERSELLIELLRDLFLRHEADDLIGELPVLEDQHGRDAANHEAARNGRVLVDVHLRNRDAAVVLRGKGINGGPQPPARTAPLGPEVHQRHAALDFTVEVAVGKGLD